MKALTIKQPWAQLIVEGVKDIENRSWKTNFRGRVYVHAAKSIPKKGSSIILNIEQFELVKTLNGSLSDQISDNNYITSAIIGEVDIVDCVINHHSIWAQKSYPSEIFIYNWVLANPVKYDQPILNVKGALSFWQPDINLFNEH